MGSTKTETDKQRIGVYMPLSTCHTVINKPEPGICKVRFTEANRTIAASWMETWSSLMQKRRK